MTRLSALTRLALIMTGFCLFILATPTNSVAAMPSGISHTFIIVMENHDWSSIKGSSAPYMNSLLTRPDASYASNYHNIDPNLGSLHPSEPNYLWLEAGTNAFSDHTFTDDSAPSATVSTGTTSHLTTLLQNKGFTWKSYQEDISGTNCPLASVNSYAPKHNPMVFFRDVTNNNSISSANCISHIRPYSEFGLDLVQNTVPNYSFITPNLDDDMHDGSIAQADTWLSQQLPAILNSSAYQNGGAVFITWDEGGAGNNPIGMIVLSPKAKGHGYTNSLTYSHASYLKTIEEIFGLAPLLGHAADSSTVDLSDLFSDSAHPSPTPTTSSTLTPTPTPVAIPTPTASPCPLLPTDLGTVTLNANVTTSGSYVAWSRIMSAGDTSNSYWLQVDDNCGINVGDNTSMPTNAWTWVDYANQSAQNRIIFNLGSGSHVIRLIGKEAGVKIDRIILTSDLGCLPTGTGDNCATTVTPTPTAAPTVVPTGSPIPVPTATVAPSITPDGSTAALIPTDDTTVSSATPGSTNGSAKTLVVDGYPATATYLKFDLSSLRGKTIKSAQLQFKVADSSKATQNVKAVDDTSWSESTLTYKNKPATGATITQMHGGTVNTKIAVDVTSYVQSKLGQKVTIEMDSTSNDGLDLYSKESTDRPVLTITMAADSVSTPTPTPNPTTGSTPTPTPTPTAQEVSTTYRSAIADSFVTAALPNANYGSGGIMTVDGDPRTILYMKFDLANLAGKTLKEARLRFKVQEPSGSTQNIKMVASNNWTESGITYNNRPTVGTLLATIIGGDAGEWIDINLTSFISSQMGKVFTIAIDSTGGDGMSIYSRNASTDKPYIRIDYTGDE